MKTSTIFSIIGVTNLMAFCIIFLLGMSFLSDTETTVLCSLAALIVGLKYFDWAKEAEKDEK